MEMTLRMPSTYVDIDREEMEYIDGGYAAWQKGLVAVAIVAAGVGLVVALSYGQIWLAAHIMKYSFEVAVTKLGIVNVGAIVGIALGISATGVCLALSKVF